MVRFNPDSDVLVATIGRPHGVRGLVHLHVATDDPASVEDLGSLHDDQGADWVVRWASPGIAALTGADGHALADRSSAEKLVNKRLYVARAQLPPEEEGEFYHVDLIGMEATTTEGKSLGRIATVHDYGAGVSLETDQGLIVPFTMACVPNVDLALKRVVILPPVVIEVEGDLDGNVQVRS